MGTDESFGGLAVRGARAERVAFLFLGELFLIPHLLPIAIALSKQVNAPRITLFVISSVHEEIIAEALERLEIATIAVRRARGFRQCRPGQREAPDLPWKLQVLARNAITILRHDVVVVAERTSLWLPRVAGGVGAAFVYNEHGAGPHANFASPRNRAAAWIMMPGEGMASAFRQCGNADARVAVVGYIKRDYLRDVAAPAPAPLFADTRKTVVYVPHWLRCKSSWWEMGERVLDYFAASKDYNLIVAPHMRLGTFVPDLEERLARYRDRPNIHVDTGSFSLIDQSYIEAADIYLGDGSSQVLEFAERPRPAIFLNPQRADWSGDPRFSHWTMGDVAADIGELDVALGRATQRHAPYAAIQQAYVARMMGASTGHASSNAAAVVMDTLAERHAARSRAANPVGAAPLADPIDFAAAPSIGAA